MTIKSSLITVSVTSLQPDPNILLRRRSARCSHLPPAQSR